MHELSIALSILEVAESEARRHGAARITCIRCRIGCLRQAHASLLAEAFDLAKVGTLAGDAALTVETAGMRLGCSACGGQTDLDGWAFECPDCGSRAVELSGGDQLELTSLDLEVSDGD
jgi:hydrogenase nickel incorporation protein HypA/HybF